MVQVRVHLKIWYFGGTAPSVSVHARQDNDRREWRLKMDSSLMMHLVPVGAAFDVRCGDQLVQRVVSEKGDGIQEILIITPPPEAAPPDPDSPLQPGLRAIATIGTGEGYLHSDTGLADVWETTTVGLLWCTLGEDGTRRWTVRYMDEERDPEDTFELLPEQLTLLHDHASSREEARAAEARELMGAALAAEAGAGGVMGFGAERELPAEIAILHLLPHLTRFTRLPESAHRGQQIVSGELDLASRVCKQWRGACLATRALLPACARDVAVKIKMAESLRAAEASEGGEGGENEGGSGSGASSTHDGEYELYHRGDRGAPIRLFCYNLLSSHPTEFLTLPAGAGANFSYLPRGGSIAPDEHAALAALMISGASGSNVHANSPEVQMISHVATRFSKLRICPWLLTVKTDDYSFSSSESRHGGPLEQVYWNGARSVTFVDVPFATARNSDLHTPSSSGGYASIDLQGTEFGVRFDGFVPRGCNSWGLIGVGLPLGSFDYQDRAPDEPRDLLQVRPLLSASPAQQRLFLQGGGYAGRLAPERDLTRDELAQRNDYDHEGRNGGWVLPLERMDVPAAPVRWDQLVFKSASWNRFNGTHPFLEPVDDAGRRVLELAQRPHEWRWRSHDDASAGHQVCVFKVDLDDEVEVETEADW